MKQGPAIVCDVDGVLIRGEHPIPGVREALIKMQKSMVDDTVMMNSVFCLLTNGGGKSEQDKVNSINRILNMPNEMGLTEKQMLCQFSPLKDVFQTELKDRLVLLAGTLDIHGIAACCGIAKYITFDEYAYLWPEISERNYHFQMSDPERKIAWETQVNQTRKIIKERLGEDFSQQTPPPLADAVAILYDPNNYEIFMNILIYQYRQRSLPIYLTNHDIEGFESNYKTPRLVYRSLSIYIDTLLRDQGFVPIICQYGKPFRLTYEYVAKYLKKLAKEEVNFTNTYMIGDNMKSDIRGGNTIGWTTILVQTGLYKPIDAQHTLQLEREEDRPTHIVRDFEEAIELIKSLEAHVG